jgi:thymidylate kinase
VQRADVSSSNRGAHGAVGVQGSAGLIWHILRARDRSRAVVKARRQVARGSLVVADRFPLPQFKMMDGPVAGRMVEEGHESRVHARLARWEKAYYGQMRSPDVLVVLRVDPEIAVSRRPDEDEAFVRTRCLEVWRADWEGTSAIVVDAGRRPADVLSEVKASVWSRL